MFCNEKLFLLILGRKTRKILSIMTKMDREKLEKEKVHQDAEIKGVK